MGESHHISLSVLSLSCSIWFLHYQKIKQNTYKKDNSVDKPWISRSYEIWQVDINHFQIYSNHHLIIIRLRFPTSSVYVEGRHMALIRVTYVVFVRVLIQYNQSIIIRSHFVHCSNEILTWSFIVNNSIISTKNGEK